MNENIEGLGGGVWAFFLGRWGSNEMIFSVLYVFRLIFIFTHFLRVVFATLLSFPQLFSQPFGRPQK